MIRLNSIYRETDLSLSFSLSLFPHSSCASLEAQDSQVLNEITQNAHAH